MTSRQRADNEGAWINIAGMIPPTGRGPQLDFSPPLRRCLLLARLSARMADWAQRVVPDPFVIALGLTLVAALLGWFVMDEPALSTLAEGWFGRLTNSGTLAFTTQMALILVAGAALARAPLLHGALARLASIPQSSASAAALTAFVAMSAGLLNWGFGLVIGAMLAREIGDRARAAGRPLNYALVGAAGYAGMMIWHGGFSGSAPLKVTEGLPGGGAGIPIDQTLFSSLNLGLNAALLIFVPWLMSRMAAPEHDKLLEPLPEAQDPGEAASDRERHPLLGRVLCWFIVALGAVALWSSFASAEVWWRAIGLNTVIVFLLLAGLAIYGTPQRYGRAFASSVGEAGGILLQFPFYFGILGVLEASGLVQLLAVHSAELSRGLASLGLPLQWSFDLVTFSSAGLVNL
ncbi:MAG: short-chain fatty acids transporter, partial [Pseudohongiellaceae bacterium]